MVFIGVGIITLCVVWALAIVICVLLIRCKGTLAYLTIVILAVASLITAALWIKFKHDQERKLELELKGDNIIYDYAVIGRTAVLVVTGTTLIVGLLSIFKFHISEYHVASRLPAWNNQY